MLLKSKWMLSGAVLAVAGGVAQAATPTFADAVTQTLGTMKAVYEASYAPGLLKAQTFGWNLDAEYAKAVSAVQAQGAALTPVASRQIMNDFIYSMRDYHVSISYRATEKAELPFMVKSAEGRYFIVYIDRKRLSEASFPFHEGDEVVTFDGLPTADAVMVVQKQFTATVPTTDAAMAEQRLTLRRAARGILVPKGAVMVGIRRKGESIVQNRQLVWEYTPEMISPMSAPSLPNLNFVSHSSPALRLLNRKMTAQMDSAIPVAENPFGLGTRKSYLPALGTKTWQSADTDVFDAYTYTDAATGKSIGVIRIPSYEPANDDVEGALLAFRNLIVRMQGSTDALVIDQINNPGGSVFYMYTLLSMLSDQPLKTPLHRMSVTQADVEDALATLEQMRGVTDDATAKSVLGDTFGGYPMSYQVAQFIKNYSQFLVDEWNKGHIFTDPFWIGGVDAINPSDVTYTKPILMVVNELDFSGGDFFPTILQDNARATIFGVRTSGAGGYVNDVTLPTLAGVNSFRVTQSLAKRVTGNPIENLGVTPDIGYSLKVEDLQSSFGLYTAAIRDAVNSMLSQP
ncbi:MAG: protease-like activity factor CPAF [Bdellovibrionales bacterium]|nr:protease-like activity factor CPAF [Bdellovibrionales bacterium]